MDLVQVIRRVQRKKAERQRASAQAFCPSCGEQTTFVTVAEAIEKHRLTPIEISRPIADGTFHRVHILSDEISICRNSLCGANYSAETQPMRTEFLSALKAAV